MRGASGVVSRRRLLTGSVGLVALSFAAGGVGLSLLRGNAPEISGLLCLNFQEYRTLSLLATTLLPAGGAFPLGAADFDLARKFDQFLADEDDDRRADLKRALLLLEYGPVLFDRRAVTFSHLAPEERGAHFERWQTSPYLVQRQVAVALRKFLNLVFYDSPEVWPSIGYTMVPT